MVHEIIVPFREQSVCAIPMGMLAREEDRACELFMGIVKIITETNLKYLEFIPSWKSYQGFNGKEKLFYYICNHTLAIRREK